MYVVEPRANFVRGDGSIKKKLISTYRMFRGEKYEDDDSCKKSALVSILFEFIFKKFEY